MRAALAAARIDVSVARAAWSRLDLDERGIDTLVRASVHYYNDEAELDRLVERVAALG